MSTIGRPVPLSLGLPLTGRMLIEASAGTGKTYTLVALVVRLIVEVGLMPDQILVVTYTRAATAELRNRIRDRLNELRSHLHGEACGAADDVIASLLSTAGESPQMRQLVDARVEAALAGLELAAIDTIHAFCQRALAEGAFSRGTGFEAEIEPEPGMVRKAMVNDHWRRSFALESGDDAAPWPPGIRAAVARKAFKSDKLAGWQSLAERAMSWSVANLTGGERPETATDDVAPEPWLTHARRQLVESIRDELPERMRAAGLSDFDGLVRTLRHALASEPQLAISLAKRHPALLIDESQDTDGLQLEIFRAIHDAAVSIDAQRALLVLVGDPKQAIYSFRGADLHSFLRVRDDFGEPQRRSLSENRRTHPSLVAAADTLFTSPALRGEPALRMASLAYSTPDALSSAPLLVDMVGDLPLTILQVDTGGTSTVTVAREAVAEVIADDIVRLLDDADARLGPKRVSAGDIAVLVARKEEGALVRSALARRGVPVASTTRSSVYTEPEAAELRLLMRALCDQTDEYRVRAALAGRIVGFDAAGLERLDADVAWSDRWHGLMTDWFERWSKQGVGAAIRQAAAVCGTWSRFAVQPGGERAMTNLLHLLQLLDAAAIDDPHELLLWFDRQGKDSSHATIEGDDPALLQIETDGQQVKVMTMHGSKGLEFPIVYLAGLGIGAEDRTHLATLHHTGGRPSFDFDLQQDLVRAERSDEFDQTMRLAYVGVTRAKSRAVIVWGAFDRNARSPMGWWLAGDVDELADEQVTAALTALAQRSAGTIGVRRVRLQDAIGQSRRLASAGAPSAQPMLVNAELQRHLPTSDRRASFTALIAQGASPDEPDHDQAVDETAVAAEPARAPDVRFAFRRGAAAGVCLHAIAETIDWRGDVADWLPVIDRQLTQSGIVDSDVASVARWFDELRHAPIEVPGSDAFRLRDLASSDWHREVAFDVPLHDADFSRVALAARAAGLSVPELPPQRWRGMLRGFIDALIVHQGRLYVLDWKSNHLGDSFADYDASAMEAEMRLHGYHLQHLLYSVAVLRFLRRRGSPADLERRFGGVVYSFIRGMAPDHPGAGIVSLAPDWALLEAIDGILQ
ncbi:hypothetical protein BH09PSE6_BH09PSE6_13560 [soil metagenome]